MRSAHEERHRSHRGGWLRAAVMGANDGILSTAGLVVGVAAADSSVEAIVVAGVSGAVAGALSMAAGKYVSVSSQRDAELADLRLEARELERNPEGELEELAHIYRERGLSPGLARQVAVELTERDALEAHARAEIGLDPRAMARPFQAAWSSAVSFSAGAILPLVAIALIPGDARIVGTVVATLISLAILGAIGAHLGGAPMARASLRVVVWGAAAMLLTTAIGSLVGAVR